MELAGVIDAKDVRMVERRSKPRLPLKSRPGKRPAPFVREELNRYQPVELRILCAVYHAHAPGAEAGLEDIDAQLHLRRKLPLAVMTGGVATAAVIPSGMIQ